MLKILPSGPVMNVYYFCFYHLWNYFFSCFRIFFFTLKEKIFSLGPDKSVIKSWLLQLGAVIKIWTACFQGTVSGSLRFYQYLQQSCSYFKFTLGTKFLDAQFNITSTKPCCHFRVCCKFWPLLISLVGSYKLRFSPVEIATVNEKRWLVGEELHFSHLLAVCSL